MAIEFNIKRGPWEELFSEPGVVREGISIEEGCWYLCSDTVELFIGAKDKNSVKLKRVNGSDVSPFIEEITAELNKLKDTKLYQRISSEYDLPTDFNSDTFNPNITYYVKHDNAASCSTYVFDQGAQAYMCANAVDMEAVRAEVFKVITITLSDTITALLPDLVRAELKNTLATTILHGGYAN